MSARITPRHYAELLLEWSSLPHEQQQRHIQNLARELISRHHTSWLSSIETAFRKLERRRAGITNATLSVPFALTDAEETSITEKFQRTIGKKLSFTIHTDPSLLTGFQLRVEDDLYDTSGRNQLQRLRLNLSRASSH